MRRSILPVLIAALTCVVLTTDAMAIYHPGLGRFAQRDPLGYPDGMNGYAGHHVVYRALDPTGTQIWTQDRRYKDRHIELFNTLCPCINAEWVESPPPAILLNRQARSRGDSNPISPIATLRGPHFDPNKNVRSYRLQINEKNFEDQDFCECLDKYRAGCQILIDLAAANNPKITTVEFGQQNLSRPWRTPDGGRFEAVSHTLNAARRTTSSSYAAPIGERQSLAARAATAGHEFSHSRDRLNRRKFPPDRRDQAPSREIPAVRTENQIYEEITGNPGRRSTHSGLPVPDPNLHEFGPCDCEEYRDLANSKP